MVTIGQQTSGSTSFPPLGSTGPLETQQDLQPSRTPWVQRQRQRLQGTISAMDGQADRIQDVDMTGPMVESGFPMLKGGGSGGRARLVGSLESPPEKPH